MRESPLVSEPAPRRPGRPLDEAVDEAILRTTARLLGEQGYARMSIAGIADEAGVGRPAIYRRFRDKAELVLAAIDYMRAQAPVPDTGSAREDLIGHLEFARRRFDMSMAGTLLVEEAEHPELLEQFRDRMIVSRNDQVAAALERGKERGEVRGDLDVTIAVHALFGAFLHEYLSAGRPGRGWAKRVVDTLWPAFAA